MASLIVEWFFFVLFHIGRIILDIVAVIFSPLIYIYYAKISNNFVTKKTFKSILITGGSSGIGKSLALQFATQPDTTIVITGRNKRRLQSSLTVLKNTGCKTVIGEIIDVTKKEEMKKFIQTMDDKYKFDLIVANAGMSHYQCDTPHYFTASERVLQVNCQGVLNTILPIIPKYQDRKSGHIAVVGSLSSYMSNSWSASYSATKSYVRFLCDDLRPKLKLIGNIDVSFIAPGYVGTRMCDESLNKDNLGFMNSTDAAKIIYNGLRNNHNLIAFPTHVANLAMCLSSLHPLLNNLIFDRFVNREQAAQQVGFFHEFDPDDEFGGEC